MLKTDLFGTPNLPAAEQEQKDTQKITKTIALLLLSFLLASV